ncbi:uncharacterized protein VP01_6611g1, partial [Puccinia sorghi]
MGMRIGSTHFTNENNGYSLSRIANYWVPLLPTAEFAHNKHNHASTGVSPFKDDYAFNLTYGQIPLDEQCVPDVKEQLKLISKVQEELKE